MKLYYSPAACSMACHITLHESGLKFNVEPVNLRTGHYKGGEFTKVNPKGYVPVLEMDNGQVLTEAAVILQYVGDQAAKANLIPRPGTMERYRCQEWISYVATEIHKGFSPLWDEHLPENIRRDAQKDLEPKFAFLANHLRDRAFLMGPQYSVADAYLFTILNWARILKIDLKPWTGLIGFMEKIASRPATAETFRAEGLTK